MMRKPLVAGNWKMHGSRQELLNLVDKLLRLLPDAPSIEIVVCPSFLYLPIIKQRIEGSFIKLGAQNHYHHELGAYTGEVAASMLYDVGCEFVILGHSERRHGCGETDQEVAEKFVLAKQQRLQPILCVGETLAEREADETANVLHRQLLAVIDRAGVECLREAVLAYEPVWAIGTGVAATAEQIQQVHRLLREAVAEQSAEVADELRIIYGGSLKPANALQILSLPDVDGGLVGGASLNAEEFAQICRAALKGKASLV